MDIILLRHATPENAFEWSGLEQKRPLTEQGQAQMLNASSGHKKISGHVTRVFSSELTRAIQTAEFIANLYELKVEKTSLLNPGVSIKQLVDFLSKLDEQVIYLVGHGPDMEMISTFLTGSKKLSLLFNTASALKISNYPELPNIDWFMPNELITLME